MKEEYFKYILPKKKKLRKENKKKIKRKGKRNAPVLRTFKYEDEDDQGLETWRKPIMLSSMSNEFALSSLRLLVRSRSSWTREEKFRICKRPCIILFII